MITLEQIRNKLNESIKLSGLSQSELARKLNIKQQTIACYLSGKAMPALDTFANLCEILDLDSNEILCLNDSYNRAVNISNCFNNSINTNFNIKGGK